MCKKETKLNLGIVLIAMALCMAGVSYAAPMGTAFTYQGQLGKAGEPVNGPHDFEFKLYDDPNVILGNQVGPTVPIADANVIDGSFAVKVDFGPDIFTGDSRWLQMAVRPGQSSDPCDFVTLRPRLELTPTPYAIYAKTAHPGHSLDAADGSPTDSVYVDDNGKVGIGTMNPAYSLDVSGVARVQSTGHANFFIQAGGVGSAYLNLKPASDSKKWKIIAREDIDRLQLWPGQVYFTRDGKVGIGTTSPTAKLHIGGTAGVDGIKFPDGTLQTTAGGVGGDSNWTISGNDMYSAVSGNVGIGTTSPSAKLDVAGHINSNESYKLDGDTVLSDTGARNILVGKSAGANISSGEGNSAIGNYALNANTTGSNNIAMGYNALGNNTEGYYNSAVGHTALYANITGLYNSVVGAQAGYSNTIGSYNTFSGYRAGYSNTTGRYNTFVGHEAGRYNTEGYHNTFVGGYAGYSNTTGRYNTFLGREAGPANTGYYNTFLGYRAGYHNQTGGGNVFIGYKAGLNETGSNKLYIANSDADPPLIYGEFSTGRVGIGTDSPTHKLDVAGNIAASLYCDRDNIYYYMDPANTGTSARFAGRVRVRVLEITGGSDLSEQFEVSGEGGKVKPGMVVCIDPVNPGNLVVSGKACDRTVAGIVSGAGGVKPGMLMGQKGTEADGEHPVALTGRVYCWADASNGPIEPGDLLTTSDMAGHAMKVTDYTKAQGAILGKAMTPLAEGRGLVLVLVTLQ